jgi:hypothetical protein
LPRFFLCTFDRRRALYSSMQRPMVTASLQCGLALLPDQTLGEIRESTLHWAPKTATTELRSARTSAHHPSRTQLCLARHASSQTNQICRSAISVPSLCVCTINTAWVQSSDHDSVRNSPVLLLTQVTHIPTQKCCTLFVFRPHAPYRVVPSRPLLTRTPPLVVHASRRQPRSWPCNFAHCTGRIAAGVWSWHCFISRTYARSTFKLSRESRDRERGRLG